jgi:hypothetical protein
MVLDTVKATYMKLDRRGVYNTFELFGYDFMIDANWKPWIIEVNTNPCLALSSSYLCRLIPEMIENMFKLTVDVLYEEIPGRRKANRPTEGAMPKNKFELIFHEYVEGAKLKTDLGEAWDELAADNPLVNEMSDEEESEKESEDEG